MGRKVDLDDLIDARGVADLIGLAHRNAVYAYRAKYADFPPPILQHGRCLLWLRPDVVRWVGRRKLRTARAGA